eukprot:12577419-Alexandrium_andersonii.AAC.1
MGSPDHSTPSADLSLPEPCLTMDSPDHLTKPRPDSGAHELDGAWADPQGQSIRAKGTQAD